MTARTPVRATRLDNGLWIRPGQEYWEDNPHRLGDRLRRGQRAGRISEVGRWAVSPGRHGAIVTRLRPEPTRRRIAALWLSGAGVAASAVGAATWWVAVHLEEIISFVIMLGAVVGALVILTRVLGGHRPTCVGIHCPGCRH